MNARVLHIKQENTTSAERLLDIVERKLDAATDSPVQAASDLSSHLFSAGGKRIRPRLVVLSALAAGASAEDERITDLACVAELVHSASLVHDDVVDETRERRGVSTANSKWGNKISVLGGDYLLSKAFLLLSGINNTEIFQSLSRTAVEMSESEMLQATSEGSISAWEANYWRIIQGKTASFLGVCCECGAILAGAGAAVRRALAEYGSQIGLAFQITDDLLDIVGDPARTGKDIGSDLMHGKFTLPILLTVQRLGREDRLALLGALESGPLARDKASMLADMTISCGAAEMARQAAVEHAEKASQALDAIPDSDHKASMQAFARSITDRKA